MVTVLRNKMIETDFHRVLDEILGQAMKMNRSKFANMQIVNRERNTLEIVNQRGFKREFLEHFSVVSADDGSACGRAMRSKNTVFISDVKTEESFAPHLQVALKCRLSCSPIHTFDLQSWQRDTRHLNSF